MILRVLLALACIAGSPSIAKPKAVSSELSKPETLLVEGVGQLRDWKATEADDTLGEVCPKFKEDAGDGSSVEDLACSARAVSMGEVKGGADSKDRADGYWWAGERARRSDKVQVARAFLDLALDRYAGNTDIWTSLGRVQRDTGDLAASTTSLRRAVELDAANFDAVYWLAANRMDQNDPAEAETLLRRIVAKDAEFGHAWYRLGELAMRRNEPQAALEMFEKARLGGVDKKLVRARIAECDKAIRALSPKASR
jgi:tetratricopeptide (TPR) repeat protein